MDSNSQHVAKAFAYYRLPYLHHATYVAQHEGEPEVLSSVAQLNGKEGFVVAPFAPSADCPVVLIHPDETRLVAVGTDSPCGNSYVPTQQFLRRDAAIPASGRNFEAYARAFACFHEQLEKGVFRKIVLARKMTMDTSLSAEQLFMRACRMYPRLFVSLVSTPQSGTWLMATPEVLLRGEGGCYQTMSLAGTQRAAPSKTVADYPVEGVEWSEKNREEQQYVTDYIERCIQGFSDEWHLKGPYTTMAANLYHLRTDIRFRLCAGHGLGDVLEALYPTPAVCGIPKEEARQFILAHEHQPRKYYSGFVGPLSPSGKTHLFVSLRCMNLLPGGICDLYAGGGLLRESEMEKEWVETEAKMQTMGEIFSVKC